MGRVHRKTLVSLLRGLAAEMIVDELSRAPKARKRRRRKFEAAVKALQKEKEYEDAHRGLA